MMTARSRGQNQDWDLEYDNSNYDPQNPDDSSSGYVNLDHCRLYITNIPKALNDDGIAAAFSKYGNLVECYVNSDPDKRYGLVSFETPGEAKAAMMKLNRTEPLNLYVNIAHKSKAKKMDKSGYRGGNSSGARYRDDRGFRDDGSTGNRSHSRRQDFMANGDSMDDLVGEHGVNSCMEPDVNLELEQLKLQHLKLQEEQLLCKQRMLLLKQAERKPSSSTRCIMPDGRIVVRSVDQGENDADGNYSAGAGDANGPETCCCQSEIKCSWENSDASSTASTCVLCSDDRSRKNKGIIADKSDTKYTDRSRAESKMTCSKTASKATEETSKKAYSRHSRAKKTNSDSLTTKFGGFYSDSEDEADETNRLIELRNTDYQDIIEDHLKIVVALAGYPKSKMRLRQMELFQRCLHDVIDMQNKAGLLKQPPVFLDYYLNRGAIICICRDLETRNWMVRISPGLQERMSTNLILLKSNIKRLCLAFLKIPSSSTTAQDAFKLLQYFNPTLRTNMWRVYSQKRVEDVEYTSFLIDRVSGEIIRGPTFKNVIDYKEMEFELSGYTEIYYECLMSDLKDDLHSVSSRAKLLNDLKSEEATPRNLSDCSLRKPQERSAEEENPKEGYAEELPDKTTEDESNDIMRVKYEQIEKSDALKKLKDVNYVDEQKEMIIWSELNNNSEVGNITREENEKQIAETESVAPCSEKTESIVESNGNLISRSSNINIDSNRGIAYHRRTNYLHVEQELKIAITLDGYPLNKLEGTHIRRLKLLFKEYLHKDMKQQRFANLIIPKFQDVYLSNGAVIYICDSLETKDYLTAVLPKFVNSTGWKLIFKDIKNLVRYTRIVMRLSKEQASIESAQILSTLQEKYPGLKPDCWKYYSDVAGKQKRQFGVDPVSLEVIKSPEFDSEYAGQKLSFRIIDRQKRDTGFEEMNQDYDDVTENKELKDKVLRLLYVPIEADMTNSPLTRMRTSHYSDVVADDLKLYVGPSNYPETRIDESLFHNIKKTLEHIVYKSFEDGDTNEISMPKFHDIYLFDGVIFVICENMDSRYWIEQALTVASSRLGINLKSTEYRGAVGIISMAVKTYLDTEEVISILQSNNPRLRTKFWRMISVVRAKTRLDVVLQIDKLSAQIIRSPGFNKFVGDNTVEFQLGHLQSLIKPVTVKKLSKSQERKLKKANTKKQRVLEGKQSTDFAYAVLKDELKRDFPELSLDDCFVKRKGDKNAEVVENKVDVDEIYSQQSIDRISDLDPMIIEPENKLSSVEFDEMCKMVVKIPPQVLPKDEEDLNLIFDLLEDNNPGLNTELWTVTNNFGNYEKGKFILSIDKQSASVIRSKNFSPMACGYKLKFLL